MLDWLKSALAVFILFVGMTIAGAVGIGFAMTCITLVTRADGLRAHNQTSEPIRGRSALHVTTVAVERAQPIQYTSNLSRRPLTAERRWNSSLSLHSAVSCGLFGCLFEWLPPYAVDRTRHTVASPTP
jgi:hypothetical protein